MFMFLKSIKLYYADFRAIFHADLMFKFFFHDKKKFITKKNHDKL